jgi:hypothetical protein
MSEVFLRLGDSVLVTIQVGTTRRGVQGGIVLNLHGRLGEASLPEQLRNSAAIFGGKPSTPAAAWIISLQLFLFSADDTARMHLHPHILTMR